MDIISFYIIYFSIFSFCGWIVESGFRSIFIEKHPINAGFLFGPFIPIYGFGAVIILLLWFLIKQIPFYCQILLYSFIVAFFEYFASFILEKIFSIKLWDYSHEKFNLNGRICLKSIFFWIALLIVNILFLQPVFVNFISNINSLLRFYISIVLLIYFIVDTFLSSKIYFTFSLALNSIISFVKKGIKFQNPVTFHTVEWDIETKRFLLALKKLPNLAVLWSKNWGFFSEKGLMMTMKWIDLFFKSKTGKKWIDSSHKYNSEFRKLIYDIVAQPIYQELKKIRHHDRSIYDHSIQVAWLSFRLGKLFNLRLKEIVKGALLHDFFFYNWRLEKPQSGKLHAFEHPVEALKNAELYYSPLTGIEKDIIKKHMWPLTISPPKYFESFIVSLVDKIVAVNEFSKKKHQKKLSENK